MNTFKHAFLVSLFALGAVILPADSSAQILALEWPMIQGEVNDDFSKDRITIDSFQWSASRPFTPGAGSNQLENLNTLGLDLTRSLDKSSIGLATEFFRGTTEQSVTLYVYVITGPFGDKKTTRLMDLLLCNAIVTSLSSDGDSDYSRPNEQLTLGFDALILTTYDETQNPVRTGYNFTTATQVTGCQD
jgi:type VI protein secretion system component Hcp